MSDLEKRIGALERKADWYAEHNQRFDVQEHYHCTVCGQSSTKHADCGVDEHGVEMWSSQVPVKGKETHSITPYGTYYDIPCMKSFVHPKNKPFQLEE